MTELFADMKKRLEYEIFYGDSSATAPVITSSGSWAVGKATWTPTVVFSSESGIPDRFYTGIGSRQTPLETLAYMRFLAIKLAREGWTLRSGGAKGADSAFEEACDDAGGRKRIYLPWSGFNGRKDGVRVGDSLGKAAVVYGAGPQAMRIAEKFHPAWDRLSEAAKRLHARNVYQVIGANIPTTLVPSEFVVCWTPGGKGGGGTGQAIRIAREYDVPVFDLAKPKHVDVLSDFLDCRDIRVEFEKWRSG